MTARAACPVVKFWAEAAAAAKRKTEMHLMSDVKKTRDSFEFYDYNNGLQPKLALPG
jgi:hypothetical protein